MGDGMARRVFRAEIGLTLKAYHRRARLIWARDALGRGETVKSIAFACGYTHLGNFTRAYRQEFGESPTETRQRTRQG
ncbi:helix-turn-helix domain-containing protein [Marivita hallyeonensis]|uniref:helix-turn-helix domain-containing protein n=1 Tax=Marivita hallyeonensis TaxID=996342 RepID=UPI002481B457|nr:helix-turn-helix domain-containing protein [Marivita hallyeonensis]